MKTLKLSILALLSMFTISATGCATDEDVGEVEQAVRPDCGDSGAACTVTTSAGTFQGTYNERADGLHSCTYDPGSGPRPNINYSCGKLPESFAPSN